MASLKKDPRKAARAAGKLGILKDCNAAFVYSLATKSVITHFDAGQFFMRQGDPGSSGFLLMYGNARAIVNGQQVGEMAKGSILGEVALLQPGTMRTASVTAIGQCIALEISRDVLIPLLDDYPEEKEVFERVAEVRSGVNKMLV